MLNVNGEIRTFNYNYCTNARNNRAYWSVQPSFVHAHVCKQSKLHLHTPVHNPNWHQHTRVQNPYLHLHRHAHRTTAKTLLTFTLMKYDRTNQLTSRDLGSI